MTEISISNQLLSSSWTQDKVFKKLYTGGKVEYDKRNKLLFTLCDGCVLAISIENGPFVIGNVGPYDSDLAIGTEHSEEVLTFGIFNFEINNKQILTIGSKGIFRLWKIYIQKNELDLSTSVKFEYLRSWKSAQSSIAEIEFDLSGQYVSTAGTDGSIQVYDTNGGFITHHFKSHKGLVTQLKFHPNRWLLFSTCVEGIMAIHDLTTSKTIVNVNYHYSVIHSFDIFETKSNSLGGLVTAGADNMLNIWDLDKIPNSASIGLLSKEIEDEFKNKTKKKKMNQEINEDFKPIKQIHTSETVFSIKCISNDFINTIEESRGGNDNKCPWVIVTGNEKSGIKLWNPVTGSTIKSITPKDYGSNQSAVLYMFLDRNNSKYKQEPYLILITEDRNIVILKYPSFKLYTTIFGNTPDYIQLSLFTSKEDGNKLGELKSNASLVDDSCSINCVILDSTETPQIMSLNNFPYSKKPLIGHKNTVLAMDISRCSNFIATGSKDETIKVWSTNNQECLATLTGHTSIITALSFQKKSFVSGNKGFYLFSASNDYSLKGWNLISILDTNKSKINNDKEILAIHNVIAHKKEINNLNISNNDRMIATCSEDKSLKIWSFPELKLLGTCKGHLGGIWQSSFSPLEKIIATASSDGMIKIWNLNSFSCIKTLQGHDGSVLQVDFLGNGLQLISSGMDNLIKLWNLSTAECIKTLSGHNDKIWTLNLLREFDKKSSGLSITRFMVTGGSDSQLILWRDNTREVEEEEKSRNLKRIEDLNEIDMLFNKKEYLNALNLSLNQKLQYKTYLILEKLLRPTFRNEDCIDKLSENSNNENSNLDELVIWIRNLNKEELSTILNFILEWITVSKTVWLSNSLMYLILTNIESENLYKIEGFSQIIQIFRSYNTKVQSHLSTLNQKSYILDYLFLSNKSSNEDNSSRENILDLTLDVLFKD